MSEKLASSTAGGNAAQAFHEGLNLMKLWVTVEETRAIVPDPVSSARKRMEEYYGIPSEDADLYTSWAEEIVNERLDGTTVAELTHEEVIKRGIQRVRENDLIHINHTQ